MIYYGILLIDLDGKFYLSINEEGKVEIPKTSKWNGEGGNYQSLIESQKFPIFGITYEFCTKPFINLNKNCSYIIYVARIITKHKHFKVYNKSVRSYNFDDIELLLDKKQKDIIYKILLIKDLFDYDHKDVSMTIDSRVVINKNLHHYLKDKNSKFLLDKISDKIYIDESCSIIKDILINVCLTCPRKRFFIDRDRTEIFLRN